MYKELITNVVTLLRNNISDPANRGTNWIYPDFPRVDAKMPRISVSLISQREAKFYGINGATKLLYPVIIEVSVWVRTKETFLIGTETYGGGKLVDYLCDEIINVLENNAFNIDNVEVVKCTGCSSIIYDDSVKLLRRALQFEFLYNKTAGE